MLRAQLWWGTRLCDFLQPSWLSSRWKTYSVLFFVQGNPSTSETLLSKKQTYSSGKLLYRIWKCLSWGFISFQIVTFPHSTAWARSRESEKPAVSLSSPSSDAELQRVHHIQHRCCRLAGNFLTSSTLCLTSVISSDVFGTVPGMQDAFCFLKTRQSEVDRLFRSARALSPLSPLWWAILILVWEQVRHVLARTPAPALHQVLVQFLCNVRIIPESQRDAHQEGNPPWLQRPPTAQAASHGQRGDSREWALEVGGVHVCGKGKGRG